MTITHFAWKPFYNWGSLADNVVLYLQSRKIEFAEVYAPYYLASIGSHIANLGSNCLPEDKMKFGGRVGNQAYSKLGKPCDLRLHIVFLAPPGGGKSLFLSLFTDGMIGFLANTHIPVRRYASISTAGLIGSAVSGGKKGEGVNIPGEAEIFKTGIFGFDELSSVLMHREDYNIEMINTILQLLDEGNITKRTLYGDFNYKTYVTLWGGTQPLRLNLSHGLARRFLVLRFSPNSIDEKRLSEVQWEGLGVKHSITEISLIRKEINDIWEGYAVEDIAFDPKIKELKDKLGIIHIDSEWIDRLCIGWNVVTNYEPEETQLFVGLEPVLEQMIINALNWRYSAVIDGAKADIIRSLDPNMSYSATEIKRLCCKNLGISYKDISILLEEMVRDGVFEVGSKFSATNRRTTYKLVNAKLLKELIKDEVNDEEFLFR